MNPISLMNIEFCLKNGSIFISLGFYRMEVVGRLLGEAASQFGSDWITTSFLGVNPFLYMEASGFPAESLQRQVNHSLALGSVAINQPLKRKTCCLINQLDGNWLLV